MSCKFRQIVNVQVVEPKIINSSTIVANETITNLIDKIAANILNKKAQQKSKHFLKNKIIGLQIDSVKQVYPNRPLVPNNLVEECSPRHDVRECLRPMSAQVRHESIVKRNGKNVMITNESKRTIVSHLSYGNLLRQRPHTAATIIQTTGTNSTAVRRNNRQRPFSSTTPHNNNNDKRFFSIKGLTQLQYDEFVDQRFIEQLRLKKCQQQQQIRKKQQFLKSIELENKNYTQSQAKFIQSMNNRKRFIYGAKGEIIQISKNIGQSQLKKISSIARSRVIVKQRLGGEMMRRLGEEEMKENIFVQFQGREGFDRDIGGNNQVNNNSKEQQNKKVQIEIKIVKQADEVKKQQQHSFIVVKKNNLLAVVNNNNNLTNNNNKNNNKPSPSSTRHQTSLKNIPKSSTNLKPLQQQTKTQIQINSLNNSKSLQQQQKKKKQQKIFFYPSVNSVYRVIDDFNSYQQQHNDSGSNIVSNEDSLNN